MTGRGRGQAMVEFALALPIFLLVVYGLMEASRAVFMYSAVTTASREAARFASAGGVDEAGVLNYKNCVGIRERARQVSFLIDIPTTTSPCNGTTCIYIKYDHGPGVTGPSIPDCTKTTTGAQTTVLLNPEDRVIVTVSAQFNPIVGLVPFGPIPMTATSSRTFTGTVDLNPPTPTPSSGP